MLSRGDLSRLCKFEYVFAGCDEQDLEFCLRKLVTPVLGISNGNTPAAQSPTKPARDDVGEPVHSDAAPMPGSREAETPTQPPEPEL
jgi:hypothetical protein